MPDVSAWAVMELSRDSQLTIGGLGGLRAKLGLKVTHVNVNNVARYGRNPAPVSELAIVLRRDRTAVRRDVRILTAFGLVNTRDETAVSGGER